MLEKPLNQFKLSSQKMDINLKFCLLSIGVWEKKFFFRLILISLSCVVCKRIEVCGTKTRYLRGLDIDKGLRSYRAVGLQLGVRCLRHCDIRLQDQRQEVSSYKNFTGKPEYIRNFLQG